MKKSKILTHGLAAIAALVAGLSTADRAGAAEELQMSFFVGPRHPMVKAVVVPLQQKLEELSGGDLTVKVHFGGSLVKGGPPQYGALLQGVSDLAFSLPGFSGPKFPFSNAVTVPGITQNAEDATNKLWNAMDVVETEYDAKIIALWAVDPKILLTKKPIRALDDLKGMKLRVTSKLDEPYINKLGAVSVASGITVVHQNFTNGVIDGVLLGATGIRAFKLHEPAEFLTTNLPPSVSPIYILMNQQKFDGLTPQQQGWVNQVAGRELSLGGGRGYDRSGGGGLKFATENGVKAIALSDAEKARWQAAMQPEVDSFLDGKIDVSKSSSTIELTGREFVAKLNAKSN